MMKSGTVHTTPALQSHRRWLAPALAALLLVAGADYLTGYELWFSIFYLLPVSVATWFVGWWAGLGFSAVSVGCSLMGDLASGAHFSSTFVPWWNVLISLSFYTAMVSVLARLRSTQQQLERRVHERTAALRAEMAERERLEVALIEVSEREQRRIGHDLHDSLCQHLTGTALAGQVLCEKLVERAPEQAGDADRLVGMIEEGIGMARSLARGLAPVELDMQGLMAALRELAQRTSLRERLECRLEMPAPVLLQDARATTQLFRIAQEAVGNAMRHSSARHIRIGLQQRDDGIEMTVEDDGKGLPQKIEGGGMGLSIMRHRAEMIGAAFDIERLARGTRVRVRMRPAGIPEGNGS